jgi:hypothetical protein
MGALTFVCPQAGKDITTGVETDQYTLSSVRMVSMRVRCEHCGREHEFTVEDGRLEEAA